MCRGLFWGVVGLVFGLLACPTGAAVIPVNSAAFHFSPGNWSGDAGRGGSGFRRTWINGSYFSVYWTASTQSPTATLLISNLTDGSAISYFLNGTLVDNVGVSASGGIPITGAAPGANVLTVYLRNSQQVNRWSLQNAFKVEGLDVDDASIPGTAPTWNGRWIVEIGDSITEGIQADEDGRDDNLADYSFLCGQAYQEQGFDYGLSACGYSGWVRPGDGQGDVPGYYVVTGSVDGDGGQYDPSSRWDKIDSLTSLLDADGHISAYGEPDTEPSAIFINYGANECLHGSPVSDVEASIRQCLPVLRKAAPRSIIFVTIPPGMYSAAVYANGLRYIAAIKAGIDDYRRAHKDDRLVVIDLGPEAANALASTRYGGGVHPRAAGHAYLASRIESIVLARLRK